MEARRVEWTYRWIITQLVDVPSGGVSEGKAAARVTRWLIGPRWLLGRLASWGNPREDYVWWAASGVA